MCKHGRFQNWIIRTAGILLCLVLASTYLVCGLFARYTTSATGSDSARVAKFQITEAAVGGAADLSQVISAELTPGVPFVAKTEVSNDSEVAVHYEIKVENVSKNLPLNFKMTAVNTKVEGEVTTFSDAMDPAEKKTYSLEILWSPDDHSEALLGMGKADQIAITLSATQID